MVKLNLNNGTNNLDMEGKAVIAIVIDPADFKAGTIREALDMAEKLVDELLKKNEEIEKAVIWDIGIKELDVF